MEKQHALVAGYRSRIPSGRLMQKSTSGMSRSRSHKKGHDEISSPLMNVDVVGVQKEEIGVGDIRLRRVSPRAISAWTSSKLIILAVHFFSSTLHWVIPSYSYYESTLRPRRGSTSNFCEPNRIPICLFYNHASRYEKYSCLNCCQKSCKVTQFRGLFHSESRARVRWINTSGSGSSS